MTVNFQYSEADECMTTRDHFSSYEKGISAELCAEKVLLSKGYHILKKRVRTKYGEIDILAQKGNDLVAVEVKQRKSLAAARECISSRQQRRISNALTHIISTRSNPFENYRIDVICLDSIGRYEHIENAFFIEEFIAA
jgi:putative endonuclease